MTSLSLPEDRLAVKGVFTDFIGNLIKRVRDGFKPKRVVDETRVADVLNKYIPYFKNDANTYTDGLLEGKFTPEKWGELMMKALMNLYLTAGAASVGHVGRMMPDLLDDINDRLKEQEVYIKRFVGVIKAEPEKWNKQRILTRLNMYTNSAHPIIHRADARSKGRPMLPFYPKEASNCGSNCKCGWNWHTLDAEKGDYNVFWELDARDGIEHCTTCLERAKACNPLEIRGGVIVTKLDLSKLRTDR